MVLEQYLFDELKPSLNKTKMVYHLYCRTWSPKRLLLPKDKIHGSKPVNILSESGAVLFYADGAAETKIFVGIKAQSIASYINNTKQFKSKLLNQNVTLRAPDVSEEDITTRSLSAKLVNTQELNLKGCPLSTLSPQFIYAFEQDKTTFEVFYSVTDAFERFYPPSAPADIPKDTLYNLSRVIRIRVNLEEPLKIEDGTLRYFAQNPLRVNRGIRHNTPPLKKVVREY